MTRAFLRTAFLMASLAHLSGASAAEPVQHNRLIVIKVDGVPADILHDVLTQIDPTTGKSRLPWIAEVFGRQGARLENFYVRGISLSAPSWAMLDTGYHQRIHGNIEWDRETLQPYDYLNFFPFYVNNAGRRRADMPGVEVLDASGIPLVIDRFPWNERYQSFQLYQRWIRWMTLQRGLRNRFTKESPRDLLDEWLTGFDFSRSVTDQTERDLLTHLQDPTCLYLDYFSGAFDHLAHADNHRAAQVAELQAIDALIGRVWTAVQQSSLANRTVLALVSDHGMNTSPTIYSQGYSLVDWFRSAEGGAHHTATDRYPLDEYRLKGLNPMVSEAITSSPNSLYLKGESDQYPTAYLDVDGNERAAIQLRNSDLNALHILLKEIVGKELPKQVRAAAIVTFFDLLDARREHWQHTLDQLRDELAALGRSIERERSYEASLPKHKWTAEEIADGDQQAAVRRAAHLLTWEHNQTADGDYLRIMTNLLALRRETFNPSHLKIESVIPRHSLGEPNSIFDLQNYVTGPSREGLVLSKDGVRLDVGESFRRIDYFAALHRIHVRNVVQNGIGTQPVDFLAARVPIADVDEAVWMSIDQTHQAIVMSRRNAQQVLELRYVPATNLRGSDDGSVSWAETAWQPGLPLQLWEDPNLDIPAGEAREAWLQAWHTDREWLNATHRTRYSNGIIGIVEQFVREKPLAIEDATASPEDAALLRRFEERRRRMVEPDFILLANDHWNFNVRNFNPGGNHGSFFRMSTHSIAMFAGGRATGIPKGLVVQAPYDSLSFAPTLLKLAGFPVDHLPGPLITELSQQ